MQDPNKLIVLQITRIHKPYSEHQPIVWFWINEKFFHQNPRNGISRSAITSPMVVACTYYHEFFFFFSILNEIVVYGF